MYSGKLFLELFYRYFKNIFNISVDINTSINDASINKIRINIANIVCLTISNLIFSRLLSFIIDLYSFIPLTASIIVAGITIKFFKNNSQIEKIIPLYLPQCKYY